MSVANACLSMEPQLLRLRKARSCCCEYVPYGWFVAIYPLYPFTRHGREDQCVISPDLVLNSLASTACFTCFSSQPESVCSVASEHPLCHSRGHCWTRCYLSLCLMLRVYITSWMAYATPSTNTGAFVSLQGELHSRTTPNETGGQCIAVTASVLGPTKTQCREIYYSRSTSHRLPSKPPRCC